MDLFGFARGVLAEGDVTRVARFVPDSPVLTNGARNRGTSIAIMFRRACAIEMMACWANRWGSRRGGEKTAVENIGASSGTRTGTDAPEGSFGGLEITQSIRWNQNWHRCVWGDAASKSRRGESHFPFRNFFGDHEPVGKWFALVGAKLTLDAS